MHARTDEEIYVKSAFRYQEFTSWRQKCFSNRTTLIRAFTRGFVTIWTWEQHGDDFVVCGATQGLEKLAEEFKGHFLVNKAEIVSLKPEHQRCWNLSVHDRATLRHCLQHEGNHERGSWTDHSLKDKVEAHRALPQRTPAMCVELPLGRQVGRRHP